MALPSLDLLIERKAATMAPEGLLVKPEVGQQPAKRGAVLQTALVALAISCALLTVRALSIQFSFSNRQKGLHSPGANLKAVSCPRERRAEM